MLCDIAAGLRLHRLRDANSDRDLLAAAHMIFGHLKTGTLRGRAVIRPPDPRPDASFLHELHLYP